MIPGRGLRLIGPKARSLGHLISCARIEIAMVGVAAASLCWISAPARGQSGSVTHVSATGITAKIDSFKDIVWRPADNYFKSPGPVRITLSGYGEPGEIVLLADDAEGQPDGEIIVTGRMSLQRSDGILSGTGLRLNAGSQTGLLTDAEARVGNMRVRGARIEMAANRMLKASQAEFTTCSEEHPHYMIVARDLRLDARGKVVARGVTLSVGGATILGVPYLEKSFSHVVESPFPLPSYSKETGPKIRVRNELLTEPRSAISYEMTASARRAPFGSLTGELDLGRPRPDAAPPATRRQAMTERRPNMLDIVRRGALEGEGRAASYRQHGCVLFASAGVNEYVYHPLRTDIRLTRLPEVGLSWLSGGGEARGGLFAEVVGGHYRENPSDASTTRAQLRVGAVTPALSLGAALALRAGMDWEGSAYGTGTDYAVASPEVELLWRPGGGTALSAAYRHRAASGATPFLFDTLDVRNEMELRYDGDYARWGFRVWVAYDADRWRAHETSLSVLHRLDCMEFGLSYRARSQGLGVVLNLLPPLGGAADVSRPDGKVDD